jgi:hypothetical protein
MSLDSLTLDKYLLPDENRDADIGKLSRMQNHQNQVQQQLQQQLLQQQLFNSELYQKLLNSGLLQRSNIQPMQQIEQVHQATTQSSLLAVNNGVTSSLNSLLKMNDIGSLFENLFGSKVLLYGLVAVVLGLVVLFIVCYCIYCCCCCSNNPLKNKLCKKYASTHKGSAKCCV